LIFIYGSESVSQVRGELENLFSLRCIKTDKDLFFKVKETRRSLELNWRGKKYDSEN